MGSNPELLRQSTHSLLHKPVLKAAEDDEINKGDCTADMLILKKATRHSDNSNQNLISDEINVQLSRESGTQKPSAQARNNNYFAEGAAVISPQKMNKNSKVLNIESDCEDLDEEEEGIVGQVDDAEEFKLGKVVK